MLAPNQSATVEWGAGRYERIAEQLLPAAEVVVAEASPGGSPRPSNRGADPRSTARVTSFPWHERGSLSGLFEPHGFSVSLAEHSLACVAPSIDEFMRIEGENHPLAIAARPVLEGAGRAEGVREGMRRIDEKVNEDPAAFRITSRYVVARLTRPA